jgi:hypothetical protein
VERRIDVQRRRYGHLQRAHIPGVANAHGLCGCGLESSQFAHAVARPRSKRRGVADAASADAASADTASADTASADASSADARTNAFNTYTSRSTASRLLCSVVGYTDVCIGGRTRDV